MVHGETLDAASAANPLRIGHPPRAHPGPVPGGHLRRHRRPRPSQDPARPLQPAPGRPAAARVGRRRRSPAGPTRTTTTGARCARPWSSTPATRSSRRSGTTSRRGIHYQQGEFGDPASYRALAERLEQVDAAAGTRGNVLFYLATPPSAYPEIVANLGAADLAAARDGWSRIVIEKPFGHDLTSGARPQRRGHARLRGVAGLPHRPLPGQGHGPQPAGVPLRQRHLRAALEPALRRPCADHRGARTWASRAAASSTSRPGASRDILQNHMLQLLSLVCMEPPIAFEADALRDEKVRVLRAIDPDWTESACARDVVRGQYTAGWVADQKVPGYREEPEVAPDLDRGDVRGAPPRDPELALGGRAVLPAHRQAAAPPRHGDRGPVQAAAADAVPRSAASSPEPNLLAMRIQPDEGILLRFAAKVPGLGLDVRAVNMDFTYGSSFLQRRPGGVRDAHPRRDAGRRLAVHPRRRGGGRLGHRRRRSTSCGTLGRGRRR